MPTIQTERLIIRTFDPEDLLPIHEILSDSFDASPGPSDSQSLRRRESWLHWSILNQEWLPGLHQPPYGDRAVVLRSTGAVIGAVGYVPLLAPFNQIPELRGGGALPGNYIPEVGLYWVIGPAHRKHGFALEAARALVAIGFADLHLARILATTEHDNLASQGVMRRLGMQIARNPHPDPQWLQIVGVLWRPG